MLLLDFALVLSSATVATSYELAPTPETDELAGRALSNAYAQSSRDGACDVLKAVVRREWSSLSDADKKDYIDANLCLMSLPARSGDFAPGARSRYDDFVAQHINLTLSIHATGNFLSWHRYYLLLFEQALRDECGYSGWLPHEDWGKYAHDPLNSPLFDGGPLTLSGNGAYAPHEGLNFTNAPGDTPIYFPPSNGSGCVTTGPFADMTVTLGGSNATAVIYPDVPPNPQSNGLGYNPRCLRRDISAISAASTTDDLTAALIRESPDIATFQTTMQYLNYTSQKLGVHTGGHYIIGGDPGGDFYASPGDPAFWLHHGNIDRVWWIWQNLEDAKERTYSIAGTRTPSNTPPSANTTLDDVLVMGVLGEDRVIKDLLNTMKEGLCYIYK